TDIRKGKRLFFTQPLLQRNIPLKRVGQFQMRIEGVEDGAAVWSGRHDRRRKGGCRVERKCASNLRSQAAKGIVIRADLISDFGACQIKEKAEATSEHRFKILSLLQLVGQSDSRRYVAVRGVVGWYSRRCEAQIRQVIQVETRNRRQLWSSRGVRHEINVPAETIRERETRPCAPSILSVQAKVSE